MSSLISEEEKQVYKDAINSIHDTFARNITVWRSSAETITSTDSNYDAFSDTGPPPQNVIYTTESKTFKARIKYIDRQEKEFGLTVANTRVDVTQEFNLVRIKVNKEARDYIQDCEKVTIDGVDFTPLTVMRPHGLFEPDYYTIYLTSQP